MKNVCQLWFADNVNQNFSTVDGKRTLHGMRLVISTTPATNSFGLKWGFHRPRARATELKVSKNRIASRLVIDFHNNRAHFIARRIHYQIDCRIEQTSSFGKEAYAFHNFV